MRKYIKEVLFTLTLMSMSLGIVVSPAMAATGDFYDTNTLIRYPAASLTADAKASLVAAYGSGDDFVKEEAGPKYLDYNATYANFERWILAGYPNIQNVGIQWNIAVYKTIDVTQFTDFTTALGSTK